MFVFSTSTIARGAKILPRWFTLAGYVVGVFMLLSASFSPVLVLAFPVWMLGLCVLLLLRARRIDASLTFHDVSDFSQAVRQSRTAQ